MENFKRLNFFHSQIVVTEKESLLFIIKASPVANLIVSLLDPDDSF